VIEPKDLCLYSTFETSKIKMDQVFNIGYQAAKNRLKNLVYIKIKIILKKRKFYICTNQRNTHEIQRDSTEISGKL
jgi:hypothetical protein